VGRRSRGARRVGLLGEEDVAGRRLREGRPRGEHRRRERELGPPRVEEKEKKSPELGIEPATWWPSPRGAGGGRAWARGEGRDDPVEMGRWMG